MFDSTGYISDEFREKLVALEEELGVPIRVVRFRRGITPWNTVQVDPDGLLTDQDEVNEASAHADDHGLTVSCSDCPGSGTFASIRSPRADGAIYGSQEYYNVPQPAAEPVSPVRISDDQLIGQVEPRLIREYIGLNRGWADITPEVQDALIEALRLSADPDLAANYEQQRREREREAIIAFSRTTHGSLIEQRRDAIDGNQRQMAEYQQYIANCIRMMQDDQQMLDALLHVAETDTGDRLIREWDQLSEHPRIASLGFVNGAIQITTTDDLRLHHPDHDETRWLGRFQIEMNYANRQIRCTNLDTPRNGRDHPHVVDGAPCFGGHDTSFYRLLGQGELYTVFELLLQYLETLNIHDEYGRYGAYWFNAPDERPLEVAEAVAA